MSCTLSFIPLSESHFPLLLKWLETPHVKLWWDKDIKWTPELIYKKYSHYVRGYKRLGNIEKPMHAFVICADGHEIGYVQYYNRHDFLPEQNYDISDLPESCAGLDIYIGEQEYTGKNIGSNALQLFIEKYVFNEFDSVFVDPDSKNIQAIKAYEKAGFLTMKDDGKIRFLNLSNTNKY